MAEYHLHAKTHSRGAGKGAGGHARYVLREGAYAEKRVEQVRVSRSDELAYSESCHMPAWAQDAPLAYWDAADQYERANGTVYREIEFALPKELSEPENVRLAQEFAECLVDVPGGHTPYTLAIHKSEQDPSLLHCHLMLSDKVNDGMDRDPALWFRRAANPGKDPAKGGAPKTQARIGQDWLSEAVRPLWARLANDALEQAGHGVRIDHRSLEARRLEREALAAQAMELGKEGLAAHHQQQADALDRPPEPKKGRVLTHGGPAQAPDRAARVVDYEAARRARAQAVAARREADAQAERDRQALEQVRREQAREAFAASHREIRPDVGQTVPLLAGAVEAWASQARADIQGRWDARLARNAQKEAARRQEQLDTEALGETRNGIRAPRPQPGRDAIPTWQVWRERVLTEAYGAEVGRALGRWVKVEVDRGSRTLHIHNQHLDLTDYGDRVVAGLGGNDKEIAAMLQIAGAKGWKALALTGDADFQMRAGAAALAAGFTLVDGELAARIAAQQEKEAQAQRLRDLEVAPILAEWMRAHPKLGKAQRRASGHLPFGCPEGLDRSDLQRPEVWQAADAWSVGRYGTSEQAAARKKDPDPLKAQAAAAGREAAYNAWAQRGITLRVGADAPAGVGIVWELSGVVTRASVEQYAGLIQDRRKRAGVDHGVVVTFSKTTLDAKKVLVLEHLLRQGLSLDEAALAKAGDRSALDAAQARLKTHEPDGSQQAWYGQKLEREEVARIRAERVQKLDTLVAHLERYGTEDAERRFVEAGFEKDWVGSYVYPDPDLPGVQKAWDALAIAQRRELEADVQKRADHVGYRAESAQWSQEQRAADPEYQRLVQEVTADPSLEGMANAAWRRGIDRAQQERLAQLERARESLRADAYNLGRRAEDAGSDAVKQAENRQEFAGLVQRGAVLGVDEKGLSQSMQKGREAYRQEVARSYSRGMGL